MQKIAVQATVRAHIRRISKDHNPIRAIWSLVSESKKLSPTCLTRKIVNRRILRLVRSLQGKEREEQLLRLHNALPHMGSHAEFAQEIACDLSIESDHEQLFLLDKRAA